MALGLIDQPIAWTASPDTALLAVIMVDVWKTTPFMALLLLAGLQMLPQECYESAKVDGVHPVKVFFKVTLPLLKPALHGRDHLPRARCLRIFDLIYVMTGNNKDTMSMSVYARQQLVDFQDVGYGSAAATMLFLIIALFTVVYLTLGRVGREDREAHGSARGARSPIMSRTARRVLGRIGFYCLLAVIIFYTVFPFYWAIVSLAEVRLGAVQGRVLAVRSRPGTTTSPCSASSRSGATS